MQWFNAAHKENDTNGFKIYTSPAQLGIDIKNITSLVEIINKMPDYSAFYLLTGDSLDGLYSKKLVPCQYGSLQITRYNINRVTLEFTGSGAGYHNFYNYTYTAFYHTSQDNVSEWIKTVNGKNYRETVPGVDSILNLYDVKTRPTSLDIDFSRPEYQDKITFMLATGSTTEGMPPTNAIVLNLGWDNGKWGSQAAIGNGTGHIYVRGFNADRDAWGKWFTVLDTFNCGSYCIPKAGGTVDGILVMQDVTLFDGKNNQKVMKAFDDGDNGNYGCELLITGNGNIFIGAGEAPANLRTALQNSPAAGENFYGRAGESMVIASDGSIVLYSNCNNIANRKGAIFGTDGVLRPLADKGAGLGLSGYRWSHVYAGELVLPAYNSHIKCDSIGIDMYMPYNNIMAVTTNYYDKTSAWDKKDGIRVSIDDNGGKLQPNQDNRTSLGSSDLRWKQLYAATSSISTSDRRVKKEISYIGDSPRDYEDTYMDDETLTAFVNGLMACIYKLVDGDSGRPHHGFIAQDIEGLLQRLGIKDHAGFIKSPKTRDVEVEKETEREVTKEDGTVETVKETVKVVQQEIIPGEYIHSLRYEEFIPDITRYCQILCKKNEALENAVEEGKQKTEELEKRVEALEKIINQAA